jgi:hypothetical protein
LATLTGLRCAADISAEVFVGWAVRDTPMGRRPVILKAAAACR